MGFNTLFCLVLLLPYNIAYLGLDPEVSEDRWKYRYSQKDDGFEESCARVQPTTRDLVKRFNSILPYFDKDYSNIEFLRKYRLTVNSMSEGEDLLDKEAAFYAAALTPLIFLQNYRDTWCLLERFNRALHLYQVSHPAEKRSALKLLQNFRAVNQKVQSIVRDLPGPIKVQTAIPDPDDDEVPDKKDIRYINEFIKNLG